MLEFDLDIDLCSMLVWQYKIPKTAASFSICETFLIGYQPFISAVVPRIGNSDSRDWSGV